MDDLKRTQPTPGRLPNLHIGTSGYSYQDWKGKWYPERIRNSEMLEYYAKTFPTVELNFSYYSMPTSRTTSSMVKRTPDSFLFTLKAHQCFTHERKYGEPEIQSFREGTQPLADSGKLGALLLQFPFSFKNVPENRDYLLRLRDEFLPWPQVAEFRHRSWYNPEVIQGLKNERIGICCVDEPSLPGLVPRFSEVTSDTAYLRFHGRNAEKWFEHEKAEERYDYKYGEDELTFWVPKIKEMAEQATSAFVFFNNHVNGQAPMNAEMLAGLLGIPVPEMFRDDELRLF